LFVTEELDVDLLLTIVSTVVSSLDGVRPVEVG